MIACAGPFVKSGEDPVTFQRVLTEFGLFGPAVNLIVRSLGVGPPGLSRLNLTLDHSCTYGTYWTTFAGPLPDELCCGNAALFKSGRRALCRYWSADLLSTGTCRMAHGVWISANFYRPTAVVLACAAGVPRSRPFCAVAAILSDCFATGNFSGDPSSSSAVNYRCLIVCACCSQLFTSSHGGCRDRL